MNSYNILVVDAGGLTSSLSLDEQCSLKAVLLTHQHYDHIRDNPAFAINLAISGRTIDMYTTQQAYDVIAAYLLDGKIYPTFLEYPPDNPILRFTIIEPLKSFQVEGYDILPVPVQHSVPTVGYQITSPDNKVFFYTSDTGPGLDECWENISPQLIIIEVTNSNNEIRQTAREDSRNGRVFGRTFRPRKSAKAPHYHRSLRETGFFPHLCNYMIA